MNLQIMSDLHLEMHRDAGVSFINSLDPSGVDILILAGDIFSFSRASVLIAFAEKYRHIIYVTGNHEYYGTTPAKAERAITVVLEKLPNVHWLRNDTVLIEGQRFIGGTLWFDFEQSAVPFQDCLNDFRLIKDFTPWVYAQNEQLDNFLSGWLSKDDVVVTHHLPSQRSVHPRYAGSALNAFFVHEMDSVIEDKQPKLWVHGHTHSQADYKIGDCRVVCNPLGYLHEGSIGDFKEKLVIRISSSSDSLTTRY